jgi:hypothetical protein
MKAPPPLELADILRQYAQEYVENHGLTSARQRGILKAIQLCRTAALGGHVEECDACGHREISYNSCRNGNCPKCQAAARAQWLEARQGELLPVEYFHLVFTIPEEFDLIALQNKKTVYGILFRAAADTLCQAAKNPKHLGAEIGFFGLLHTWGQTICHHPHVHFVIPGGGLSADKTKWISAPKGFFLPVEILKIVFRGKFIDFLKRAYGRGELVFHNAVERLANPKAFEAHLDKASKHEWYVHVKPPFGGPEQVLKYLARYTHRVAISNQRLVSMEDGKVTFRWKDYADHNRVKLMTLSVFEFIRRFLLHVLPRGFNRIRYYGFLSPRKRQASLDLCRDLLTEPEDSPSYQDCQIENHSTPEEDKRKRCPICKEGFMVVIEELDPDPHWRIQRSIPELVDTS